MTFVGTAIFTSIYFVQLLYKPEIDRVTVISNPICRKVYQVIVFYKIQKKLMKFTADRAYYTVNYDGIIINI